MQGIVPLIIATTAISAATISLFLLKYQGQTASLTTALTMGFTCLFLAQGFHAIALSRGSLIQHWTMTVCALSLAVLQVLMVQVAPLNTVFGFAPLEASEWLIVSFAATSVLWVQEILRAS
jgi:magnesium-transporting ATPase (P-type)